MTPTEPPVVHVEVVEEDPIPFKPLGRRLEHDPRSRDFPIRAAIAELPASPPRHRPWYRYHAVYSQGPFPSCTFQAVSGLAVTEGFAGWLPPDDLDWFAVDQNRYDGYREAQKWDAWPGEEPTYEGSSGIGALKAAKHLGRVPDNTEDRTLNYGWAFGLGDVLQTLNAVGSVAIGSWWYAGMDVPDADGFAYPTGSRRGGHEYQAIWNNQVERYVECVNSWGIGYGQGGRFKLKYDDLEKLLEEGGDGATWYWTKR